MMFRYGYILVVGLLTLLVAWPVFRRLRLLREQRRELLSRRKEPGAIPTRNRKQKVRAQQIKRMESHLSITSRTLVILLFLAGGSIASIPFLGQIAPSVLPLAIAATSVIVGITAKPIIENITCGLVLSFGRLARIGDTVVIDDVYGVLEDFTLTHSIIKRWDSLRYVVPNSSMMCKEFINYSLHDANRWVYVEFWIDYRADMELVEKFSKETPLGSQYYSDREAPRFWVVETGREAIKCMVVAWAVTPADGWMLSHDIRKALVLKLKEYNIMTHTHRIQSVNPEELEHAV